MNLSANHMIHYTSFMRPIAALLIAVAIPVSLSGKENRHEQKRDHHFTFKKEPLVRFVKNGPGVVTPYGNNTVYNLRAVKLSDFGDSIVDVEITPFSYVVITKGKKHNAAKVMNPIIFNGELHNFKYKNIGSPTAVTFTPDMRQLLLATDKGVLIMGSQRYQVTDTIEVPFTVRDMRISDNAYYLLARGDNQVAVYNLEEKKLRKKWKFDEKVTDARFSDDNSELAILTDDGVMSIYDTRSY